MLKVLVFVGIVDHQQFTDLWQTDVDTNLKLTGVSAGDLWNVMRNVHMKLFIS